MHEQLARLKNQWNEQVITLLEYVQKVYDVISQYETDGNVVNDLAIEFILGS
jgi:hypothetical protein